MYSVVLMAALTTGVDLPDGRRGGGCGGGCYGGCYGGGGGGRHHGGRRGGGGGCCGCYGGGGYGGGYGGCMGMGYGGGYGGCMGMGYGGGYGGCMGMGMGYGGGCYGSGMGMGYSGGCYGGGMMMQGGAVIQGGTTTGGEKLKNPPVQKRDESMGPAPATIVVDLPAEAKLFIDNEATSSTGSSRVFQSPVLNTGKEYHYTLKAEIVRNGKPVKAEQVVTVKAGVITPVTLTLPPAGVAQH